MTARKMPAESEAARTILDAADAIFVAAADRDPRVRDAEIEAIGWGTVDLDRAEAELGAALARPLSARPRTRDASLAATVRAARPFGPPPAPELFLLEPDAEGRLAALLARHGEGVLAIFVRSRGGTRRVLTLEVGRAGDALRPTSDRAGRPRRVSVDRPPSGAA